MVRDRNAELRCSTGDGFCLSDISHYNELQGMVPVLLIHETLAVMCMAWQKWDYWAWGFFYEKLDLAYQFVNLPHTHLPASAYILFFWLCLWKKSYFLLCIACYFCYGLNHTPAYLFRGLIPFTYLYPNVAQNKSVSWSLTTSTWLFHRHIKNQCHNATLFCCDCGLNKSSHKK